jgi:CheY-like chemotaxis protein
MAPGTADRADMMQQLLLLSRDTLLERVDVLERAAVTLLTTGELSGASRELARSTAHQLVSLGCFGIDRGAVLARRAVELLAQEPLPPSAGVVLAETALGIRDAVREGAPTTIGEPSYRPSPATTASLLLIDDDPLLIALLTRALSAVGYDVRHACDGEGALQALADGPVPALVLLDIDLPGLNGFSVLRDIRERGMLAQTKVLILSARGSESDVIEALHLGAAGHVSKPFSLPMLLARVAQLLGTS